MITLHRARPFLKLPLIVAIGMASFAAQNASAHGYIESPPSRAYQCNTGKNTSCGIVRYVPQSVEYFASTRYGHTSFPSNAQACDGDFRSCGPADGKIASGGLGSFGELNEQTTTRWKKNSIKPGPQTFTWHYTAQHKTRYYQFYITKKDWNPNQPLTRDSFEMTPLLDEPWDRSMPGKKTQHTVNIPADRSGYHVLLATWKVDDNLNTFYQVVDLDIDNPTAGTGPGPIDETPKSVWTDIGAVQPEPLAIGDSVRTRVFTEQGEQLAKQVTLAITSSAMADKNAWPLELAKKVNAANLGYQMGELDDKDRVIPALGKNAIFARNGSGITDVIIDKQLAVFATQLSINGLLPEYSIKDGQVELHFNAILKDADPNDSYVVHYALYNAAGTRIKLEYGDTGNLAPHFSTALKDVQPGKYELVVVANAKRGSLLQETVSFVVKPAAPNDNGNGGNTGTPGTGGDIGAKYDHVFPQGLSTYKAGTLVLQPKDGKTYKCKGHPYSGYCMQWKTSATQYEPGTGSHWKMAWDRQ
ncbi:N-acetylglucosamine-binding protein GbpA [Pseudomonas protegens]|uniref:N-acetylglucosamine-binding protein GbpA n=1 Tax=Pseudomonas protegens TaxID=380021 RepID=UPI00383BD6A7